MANILVAYFSASGVTEHVAKNLAQSVGADTLEIVPQEPYTNDDLNWMNKKSRSSVEMNNRSFRPALAPSDADLTAYDTVFLGFPIWWGVAPTIVNTFLEAHDFSGKKIVLFATSGGSGMGRTAAELQPSAPDARITGGKIFGSRASAAELKQWAEASL